VADSIALEQECANGHPAKAQLQTNNNSCSGFESTDSSAAKGAQVNVKFFERFEKTINQRITTVGAS
jgi:hypothetical protein